MAKPKRYWKLNQILSFKSDFEKLPGYEQWCVNKHLMNMIGMKDPSKKYQFTRCNDLRKDLYLFGIADDGLGNKGIELQVYLDRKNKVLSPITVRKILKP